jgi:UDP:flavonoid glycosyltransferase YjiC (YdhE family)
MEAKKRYYAKNKDKIKAKSREYQRIQYKLNADSIREKNLKHYHKNADIIKEKNLNRYYFKQELKYYLFDDIPPCSPPVAPVVCCH